MTPQAVSANWAPDSSKLTFYTVDASSGEELTDIWVVNADGTGARNLTSSTAINESFPSFSPDGERIAYFQAGRGNNGQELWVMNADGSNKKRLATNAIAYGPAQWSPDAGTRILYTVAGDHCAGP